MNVVLRLTEAGVEFVWWGLHSHFCVQPNYIVEIVLRCVVVTCYVMHSRLRVWNSTHRICLL